MLLMNYFAIKLNTWMIALSPQSFDGVNDSDVAIEYVIAKAKKKQNMDKAILKFNFSTTICSSH